MRHDVAIYAPDVAGVYSRHEMRTGGAERQTNLLARALSERGERVAQIIWAVDDPLPVPNPRITLVMRPSHSGDRRLAPAHEIRHMLRSLQAADAAVYVFRTGSPLLGVVATFCQLRGRGLIFAGSTDSDFTLRTLNDGPSSRSRTVLYRTGLRRADAVVVQSTRQLEIAHTMFPELRRVVRIPSFAEPMQAAPRPGRAFVWIGRTTDYKRPLMFVELAKALPEVCFEMVIVPAEMPPGPLVGEVQRRAAALPNLKVIGPQPHADLMRLIDQAVAVVNTSQAEGMPNVFLEGWARGVPALTLEFDPDGLIGARGIGVAAGGSWERFVAGAQRLWDERSDSEQLARAGRAYVDEVHGLDNAASLWLQTVRAAKQAHGLDG